MHLRLSSLLVLATLLFTGAAFGAVGVDDAFQVNYASNFNLGPVNVRVINAGALGTDNGGFICVNLYQFDASQHLQSCCSCAVSANGLVSLPITGFFSAPLVIKLLATIPNNATPAQLPTSIPPTCNATTPVTGTGTVQSLAPGMAAWTDSTPFQSPTHFQVQFVQKALSVGEAVSLSQKCTPALNTGTCTGCPSPAI